MSTITTFFITRLQGLVNGGNNAFQVRYIQGNDNASPATSTLPLTSSDRRMLCKTLKYMDDVVKLCQSPRLNLKNSPPFILDILPDTYTQLMYIFTQNNDILRDNEYLKIFLENMQQKCKEVLKLFKTTSIFDETSEERRKLTKLSLTFSHMLFELKAEFPQGHFIGDKFRITKREAEEFWQKHFQKRVIVPWADFMQALEQAHTVALVRSQMSALKATIDLVGNDHVSNFEFDVFTRLFYPWKTLIRNWNLLTSNHSGYVAFLTYDEVKKRLEKLTKKPGSYVFRLSCTRPGQWAIGYVAPDGKIYQTIPQNKSLIQALHEGNKEGFYMYPNGQDYNVDLSQIMEVPQADRVKVTSEQYELYCEMGTTFELCKICDDNEKNIKIEPCGHLLCAMCLASWQDSEGGNTCPFCRYEIKGTNRVIIDRFRPAKKEKRNSSSKAPKDDRRESNASMSLISFTELPVAPPPLPPRPVRMRPPAPKPLEREHSYVNLKELLAEGAVLPIRTQAPHLSVPQVPAPCPPPPLRPRSNPVPAPRTVEYINTCDVVNNLA